MPFDPIGTYACKALDAKLVEFYGQNAAEFRTLGSIGLLKWLRSPQNMRGFRQLDVESIPGKKRAIAMLVDNPFCFDLCSLAADCNTTRIAATNPAQEIVFELTSDPYRVCNTDSPSLPDRLTFTRAEMMKYCTISNTEYMTRQIARYNKRFVEALDQRIFEILAANVGTNANGAATTDLTFFTTNVDTGQSNLNAMAIFFLTQMWRDAANEGQYALIGGQSLAQIAAFKNWQGLNAMGVDLGNLNEELPFIYYDRNADAILTPADFLQIAPGAVQLVTWNEFKGENANQVTDLYTNGTFTDPATGIVIDFRWRFDYECLTYTYEPFLSAELAVNRAGGCGEGLAGVNGIVRIHSCGAITEPVCAS